MAPFAVCSNSVNGISSPSTASPHLVGGGESLTPVALCADGLKLISPLSLKACLTNLSRTTPTAQLLNQVNWGFKSAREVCLFRVWDVPH